MMTMRVVPEQLERIARALDAGQVIRGVLLHRESELPAWLGMLPFRGQHLAGLLDRIGASGIVVIRATGLLGGERSVVLPLPLYDKLSGSMTLEWLRLGKEERWETCKPYFIRPDRIAIVMVPTKADVYLRFFWDAGNRDARALVDESELLLKRNDQPDIFGVAWGGDVRWVDALCQGLGVRGIEVVAS